MYLEVRDISKSYDGVMLANDHVNMKVEAGEIHGLVGENGAGKSTLMKILYGVEQPDSGEIWLDGKRVRIPDPMTAIRLGIGMVHQHFQLVPSFTVAENVTLGSEPHHGVWLARQQMMSRVHDLSEQYGLAVDPAAPVRDLSVGMQQRVEILKMLYRNARLLILDEPTAVLTPQEVDSLFKVIQRLVANGYTAIFITHKLYEITALCQRVTVLRRGRSVGELDIHSTSPSEIAQLMVGHEVSVPALPPRSDEANLSPKLAIRDISVAPPDRKPILQNVNLEVFSGEILGIAGVEGNGQSELIEVLIGSRAPTTGSVQLDGTELVSENRRAKPMTIRQRREVGLAIIPEDRNLQGLSGTMEIWENLAATHYYRSPVSRFGWIRNGYARQEARSLIQRFDIRTQDEQTPVSALSGGNAQKIVIARELQKQPTCLIAAQPTRGLDIGAARFVHEQMIALRRLGVAILLISADLDELLFLSDRVAVIYEGRIQAILSREEATRERVGLLMAGKVEAQSS